MIQCRNNFQCKGSNNSQMILTVVTRPFFKESFIMQLLSLSTYGECIDEPNALARVFSLLLCYISLTCLLKLHKKCNEYVPAIYYTRLPMLSLKRIYILLRTFTSISTGTLTKKTLKMVKKLLKLFKYFNIISTRNLNCKE